MYIYIYIYIYKLHYTLLALFIYVPPIEWHKRMYTIYAG